MDEGKRQLLKALPFAALAPVFMAKIGTHEAAAYEMKPEKKYVFKLSADVNLNQDELNALQELLTDRGVNATMIQGDVEIYELQ